MRITKIACNGFKSGPSEYHLGSLTLLLGANGAGKSRPIQALRYALTGKVPSGSSLDRVATYFGSRGGSVEVFEESGHWIQRGIKIDQEKAKVSEVFETSDGGPERWQVDPVLLDLNEFLGLSPNLRREYVLKLCGSSERADIFPELELAYAKEGLGNIATAANLDASRADLAADEWMTIDAWHHDRGIKELVRASLVAGQSMTEQCLTLALVAKEARLYHGRLAKEAKSAQRELEAASAEPADSPALLEERRVAIHVAQEALIKAEKQADRYARLAEAYKAAKAEFERHQSEYDRSYEYVQAYPSPGPRPDAPGKDKRLEELQGKCLALRKQRQDVAEEYATFSEKDSEMGRLNEDLARLRQRFKTLKASPIGKVVEILSAIPDSAHGKMPELREALALFTKAHALELEETQKEGRLASEAFTVIQRSYKDWPGTADSLVKSIVDLDNAINGAEAEIASLQKATQTPSSVKEWEKKIAREAELQKLLVEATTRLSEGKKALVKATNALEDGSGGGENLDAARSALNAAQAEFEKAEKAAGARRAYDEAGRRAYTNGYLERGWKIFEAALKTVRERLIGKAAAPLLEKLNEFLARTGRKERAYLDLENERGTAIFELGWTRGKERIALEALSGGEAAIFGAGLALAMALTSKGRKMLLLEADAILDLESTLRAIEAAAELLDVCLVATCHKPYAIPEKWTVLNVGVGPTKMLQTT